MANIGYDDATGLQWLDDAKEHAAWYEALAALDVRDDKQPLINLLQSGEQVPPSIAFYIGDLLSRHTLKHRKSRPRTPGYLRTPDQIKIIAAVIETHRRVDRHGDGLAVVLQQVAAEADLDEETLTAAYSGKHGGLQRAARHWYQTRP
jgi:hypothetical protein